MTETMDTIVVLPPEDHPRRFAHMRSVGKAMPGMESRSSISQAIVCRQERTARLLRAPRPIWSATGNCPRQPRRR